MVEARVFSRWPDKLDSDRQPAIAPSNRQIDARQMEQRPDPVEGWVSSSAKPRGRFTWGAWRKQDVEARENRLDLLAALRGPGQRDLVVLGGAGFAFLENVQELASQLI